MSDATDPRGFTLGHIMDRLDELERPKRPDWTKLITVVVTVAAAASGAAAWAFYTRTEGKVLESQVGALQSMRADVKEQGRRQSVMEVNIARIGERLRVQVEKVPEQPDKE